MTSSLTLTGCTEIYHISLRKTEEEQSSAVVVTYDMPFRVSHLQEKQGKTNISSAHK